MSEKIDLNYILSFKQMKYDDFIKLEFDKSKFLYEFLNSNFLDNILSKTLNVYNARIREKIENKKKKYVLV